MSILPTLYTHTQEAQIFTGPSRVVAGPEKVWLSPEVEFEADEVGMFGIDYAIKAAVNSAGEITQAETALVTQNVTSGTITERQKIRGSRTWTRQFLPVDTGKRKAGIATNDSFRSTDEVYVRRLFAHRYKVSPYVHAIDQLEGPTPLSGVQTYDTLEGAMRMQRTGNTGCQFEMTLCFLTEKQFNAFMKNNHDGYMALKTRYGLYAGYLQGTDSKPMTKGASIFLRVKLLSPQRAGAGSSGI